MDNVVGIRTARTYQDKAHPLLIDALHGHYMCGDIQAYLTGYQRALSASPLRYKPQDWDTVATIAFSRTANTHDGQNNQDYNGSAAIRTMVYLLNFWDKRPEFVQSVDFLSSQQISHYICSLSMWRMKEQDLGLCLGILQFMASHFKDRMDESVVQSLQETPLLLQESSAPHIRETLKTLSPT